MLGPEIGVPHQVVQLLVAGDHADLFDLVAGLEQPAGAFMTHVVEVQIHDAKPIAQPLERVADPLRLHRKDARPHLGLALDHLQRITDQWAPLVVANGFPGMLSVPDQDQPALDVEVFPQDPGQFAAAHGRQDCQRDQVSHRRVSRLKQLLEFMRARAPVTMVGWTHQAVVLEDGPGGRHDVRQAPVQPYAGLPAHRAQLADLHADRGRAGARIHALPGPTHQLRRRDRLQQRLAQPALQVGQHVELRGAPGDRALAVLSQLAEGVDRRAYRQAVHGRDGLALIDVGLGAGRPPLGQPPGAKGLGDRLNAPAADLHAPAVRARLRDRSHVVPLPCARSTRAVPPIAFRCDRGCAGVYRDDSNTVVFNLYLAARPRSSRGARRATMRLSGLPSHFQTHRRAMTGAGGIAPHGHTEGTARPMLARPERLPR